MRVSIQPAWKSRDRQHIIITDEQDNPIGFIAGRLTPDNDGALSFSEDTLANKDQKNTASHTPRAVGATIAELVSSGTIKRWYSSKESFLLEDGKKMYRGYLTADKRLVVVPPSAETQFRYVISANPTNR